jgi:hypothetical protein
MKTEHEWQWRGFEKRRWWKVFHQSAHEAVMMKVYGKLPRMFEIVERDDHYTRRVPTDPLLRAIGEAKEKYKR